MVGVVACFFLCAGAAKLADLPAFAEDLRGWSTMPVWIKWLALVFVPPVEVLLGGLWIARIRRGMVTLAIAAMLLAFSGVYVVQLVLGEAPSCGCLGRLAAFQHLQKSAAFVLGRNGVLCAMLLGSMALQRSASTRIRKSQRTALSSGRSAFTLIETVLVIAISVILLALLAPSLARVRDAGKDVVSAANLRSHGQVVNAYLGDWDDSFPWFTDPQATYTIFRFEGRVLKLRYFDAHAFWNLALAPGYYEGNFLHPSFAAPGNDPQYVMSDYLYSCTFLAGSDFWEQAKRSGPAQWRCVRGREVDFPSQKGVFYAPNARGIAWKDGLPTAETRERRGIGLVDGSAEFRPLREFRPGYPNGEGDWPGTFHSVGADPVLHTVAGSRGID
jgi:competence protein ComGC